jgi:hypothetical protein
MQTVEEMDLVAMMEESHLKDGRCETVLSPNKQTNKQTIKRCLKNN